MLFSALTRHSLIASLSPHPARQFSIAPGWFLTCVTDDFLSRLDTSEEEIALGESLMAALEPREHDVMFVEARFLRARNRLEVLKHPISGRPVYYGQDGQGNFFLSTHIQLLRQAGVSLEEDPEVLPELLIYRTVAPPRTLFRGIRQMQLAGSLSVELKAGTLVLRESRTGYYPAPLAETPADPAGSVADLLSASIDRLAPAASRVATLLSGGVDSSILSSIVKDRLAVCDTYSTSYPFDGPATNYEQKYALSAASAMSTRHTLFSPTPTDYLTGFIDAVAVAEAPLNHLQSVPLYLLFQEAIPVNLDRVVCGEGADTAFGVETLFNLRQPTDLLRRFCALPPVHAGLRALSPSWPRARHLANQVAQRRALTRPISDPLSPMWKYHVYGNVDWVESHYSTSWPQIMGSRSTELQTLTGRPFEDMLALYALNHCDVSTTTAVWSKLGEGKGKILYFPFTSESILRAAFSIPWKTKLKSEKHVVREAGRRLGVPELILDRPKQSFGITTDQWAVKGGPLEPLIGIAAKAVDIKQLRSLQGTEPTKAMTLWCLLNYAVLQRLFVMGHNREALQDELSDNCRRVESEGHLEPLLPFTV